MITKILEVRSHVNQQESSCCFHSAVDKERYYKNKNFVTIHGYEIKLFINSSKKPNNLPELSDINWLGDLAFFADLTSIMGELNRKLQSNNKIIYYLFFI